MSIDIAERFSRYPSGRVEADGPNNGQKFRDKILVPALEEVLEKQNLTTLVVDIDGCRSLGSSFLEEAFGGLSRLPSFPFTDAIRVLKIRCTKPQLQIYHDAIIEYLEAAKASKATA